jgi:hypothetical protein
VNADVALPGTGMVVQPGGDILWAIANEHPAYWLFPTVVNDTAQLLR